MLADLQIQNCPVLNQRLYNFIRFNRPTHSPYWISDEMNRITTTPVINTSNNSYSINRGKYG